MIIHIATINRMKELFLVNGECGVYFKRFPKDNNKTFIQMTCAGKVHLLYKGRETIIRYIIEEKKNQALARRRNAQ